MAVAAFPFVHDPRRSAVSNIVELETRRVESAKAGDRQAFQSLYQSTRDQVARLLFRMGIAHSEIEDVEQEVFIQVFRSLKDFRGQSKFSTWVHKIAVNVVLMHRRAKKVRPMATEEIHLDMKAKGAAPDEQTDRQRRMRAFAKLLESLTEKKRDVFVLHDLEGMSPAEIAEVVGAPVLTIRTRLFYARRELDEMMRKDPVLAEFAGTLTSKAGGDHE